MALTQAKIVLLFIAMMVLISSAAAAVAPQDFIIKPSNLGRKLLATYYSTPSAYAGRNGGGGNPCCK
ncbi:hypothetical protein Gohar_008239 [Gossypium harknessii]|uniref:Uncharacterized protein n=1 Tax=Gossypium harknessii TaxID=34285 RepID=A0A7J9GL82_9ROSI|nr:hypothetical protein [Gossypium harknessii]